MEIIGLHSAGISNFLISLCQQCIQGKALIKTYVKRSHILGNFHDLRTKINA